MWPCFVFINSIGGARGGGEREREQKKIKLQWSLRVFAPAAAPNLIVPPSHPAIFIGGVRKPSIGFEVHSGKPNPKSQGQNAVKLGSCHLGSLPLCKAPAAHCLVDTEPSRLV